VPTSTYGDEGTSPYEPWYPSPFRGNIYQVLFISLITYFVGC
jgi:hypothetical protein